MEKLFIRFGAIPEDEKSIVNFHTIPIKKEKGVSCYHAVKYEEQYLIVIPPLIKPSFCETLEDLYKDYTYGLRKAYLVSGTEVGTGEDGEPLIQKVKIIKELKNLFKFEELSNEEVSERDKLYETAVKEYIKTT